VFRFVFRVSRYTSSDGDGFILFEYWLVVNLVLSVEGVKSHSGVEQSDPGDATHKLG